MTTINCGLAAFLKFADEPYRLPGNQLRKMFTDEVQKNAPNRPELQQTAKFFTDALLKHRKTPELSMDVGALPRSSLPLSAVNDKDMRALGFLPSYVAVPERGQQQFRTWRHPRTGMHLHKHKDRWIFHEDNWPSFSMQLEKYKQTHPNASWFDKFNFGAKTFFQDSLPHVVYEGVPGYVNYTYNTVLGNPTFGSILSNTAKQKTMPDQLGRSLAASMLLGTLYSGLGYKPENFYSGTGAGLGFMGGNLLSKYVQNAAQQYDPSVRDPGIKNLLLSAGIPLAGTAGGYLLGKKLFHAVERARGVKRKKKPLQNTYLTTARRLRAQDTYDEENEEATKEAIMRPLSAQQLHKQAVEVIQPFEKHKLKPELPIQLQQSIVNKAEAEAIARAMAAAAPHAALANTRVDLYGTRVKDLQERMVNNPRLAPHQRWGYRYTPIEGLPDNTQLLPDAYHPHADSVWLPSGNPGVLMHELGHGIDFNAYPNTTPRMLTAGLYARLAPTLWKEHAAWRKGQKYFLEGAAQHKLPPELVVKTLRDASRGKRTGLSSYWGAGLGGLAGLAAGGALAVGSNVPDLRLPLLGSALGGALGGLGGITLGNLFAESNKFDSPEYAQKYLNHYAKTYAKKHDLELDDAHAEIQQLAKKIIADKDNKKKKTKAQPRQLAKAAGLKYARNLGLSSVPTGTGPDQIADALFRFNQLRSLVRPTDATLKGRNLSRSAFQKQLRKIVSNSQNSDRYDLKSMAPNPKLRAGLAGLAGLAGTGALTYTNGLAGLGTGLLGTGLAAGATYLHGQQERENFTNTARLLKDYGLLRPQLLRQAYPLLGDNPTAA